MEKQSTYREIEQYLLEIDAFTEAAETHGILCGFICAGSNETDRHWMQTILNLETAHDDKKSQALANIITLYEQSFFALQDINLELELLLPDDIEPLPIRARALSLWCQGFLSGIALGSGTLKHTDPDISELMTDITEISKLDTQKIKESNEEEEQLVELSEHVRMSTLLLYTLLQAPNYSKPH